MQTDEPPPVSSRTPLHEFLYQRLRAAISEAEQKGFAKDASVATILDLISGPEFDFSVPDATSRVLPQLWNEPSER